MQLNYLEWPCKRTISAIITIFNVEHCVKTLPIPCEILTNSAELFNHDYPLMATG